MKTVLSLSFQPDTHIRGSNIPEHRGFGTYARASDATRARRCHCYRSSREDGERVARRQEFAVRIDACDKPVSHSALPIQWNWEVTIGN